VILASIPVVLAPICIAECIDRRSLPAAIYDLSYKQYTLYLVQWVKENSMSRHLSIHEIDINENQQAELERFFRSELCKFDGLKGWNFILLKGSRGCRTGQYAVLIEIEKIEALNRYTPQDGVPTDEMLLAMDIHFEIFKKWENLVISAQQAWSGYDVLVEVEKMYA
jgi:hypothetical protein